MNEPLSLELRVVAEIKKDCTSLVQAANPAGMCSWCRPGQTQQRGERSREQNQGTVSMNQPRLCACYLFDEAGVQQRDSDERVLNRGRAVPARRVAQPGL